MDEKKKMTTKALHPTHSHTQLVPFCFIHLSFCLPLYHFDNDYLILIWCHLEHYYRIVSLAGSSLSVYPSFLLLGSSFR